MSWVRSANFWKPALGLGLLTALMGVATLLLPPFHQLETDLGLRWLFALRGVRPAPADVVVVTLDRDSFQHLGLPEEPDRWPRSRHAQLVRRLHAQGAGVIVFDLFFRHPSPDPGEDRQLARAFREAGNVVLFEDLRRQVPPPAGMAHLERRYPPVDILARAAVATAPFHLPKLPIRVNRCWLFKTGAGELPTLPVVALHVHARDWLDELAGQTAEGTGGEDPLPVASGDLPLGQRIHALRQAVRNQPHPRPVDGSHRPEAARRLLTVLRHLYRGADSRYLDFYGPPRTVTTIAYHDALADGPAQRFRDKAVFVGVSQRYQPEQREDGFYTVFSQPDGLDLSGVEILATTFGNLLENRWVRPLSPRSGFLVAVAWGLLLGVLFIGLTGGLALVGAAGAAALYLSGAVHWFAHDGTWLPLTGPLLLQLPLALLAALLWRYQRTRRERHRMRQAFGYYLPGEVVERLLDGPTHPAGHKQRIHGVYLASDAERYTRLSESLDPDHLHRLLNRYYGELFAPVRRHGGVISDVVGDAMLALWVTPDPDPAAHRRACLAALDINRAVEEFNRRHPGTPLPTRLGLHCGECLLGYVGAGDHYEYRAVGDPVNTANRIQSLNKRLGTRALATREVVEGLSGIVTREVGRFYLPGKARLLTLHELVCRDADAPPGLRERHQCFAQGLAAFRARQWHEAVVLFNDLVRQYPDEGPARYYLWLCRHYLQHPPTADWDGVASLERRK